MAQLRSAGGAGPTALPRGSALRPGLTGHTEHLECSLCAGPSRRKGKGPELMPRPPAGARRAEICDGAPFFFSPLLCEMVASLLSERGDFFGFCETCGFFLPCVLLKDSYERVGTRDRGFISYAIGELLGLSNRVSLASLATFVTPLVFTKLMAKRNTFSNMP